MNLRAYKFTTEHRANISRSLIGNKRHLGHKHSEETKEHWSIIRKGKRRNIGLNEADSHKQAKLLYWSQFTTEERKQKCKHLKPVTRGKCNNPEHKAKLLRKSWTPEKKRDLSLKMKDNHYGLGYKFTLEQRLKNSEVHKGEKSHLWLGGKSFEPYSPDFNNNTKLKIRIRDNFTCQLCNIPENGHKHHVHHIDYDKSNISDNNLITLCNPCHTKTNHRRHYYQSILTESIFNHFNKHPIKETENDYKNQ